VDASVPLDVRHSRRAAKSCGPGVPVLAPSSRDVDASCGRRGQSSRSPGRARISRSNHRAGKAGMLRPSLWFLPPCFSFARGPWERRAPGLPCALSNFRADMSSHHSGAIRRENAKARVVAAAQGGQRRGACCSLSWLDLARRAHHLAWDGGHGAEEKLTQRVLRHAPLPTLQHLC
jgi:hypothetical protein